MHLYEAFKRDHFVISHRASLPPVRGRNTFNMGTLMIVKDETATT